MRRSRYTVSIVAAAAITLAACGGDAQQTGEVVIENQIAEQIGLGELEAMCDQPDEAVVGETFACTATTESGDVIQITTFFDPDDKIFVLPTNVVLGEEIPLVEEQAATVLTGEVGVTIDPSDVDCPDTSVVLDENDQFMCEITEAATGDVYALTVTLTDLVRDEGFQNSFYEIGDAPLR